MLCRNYTGAVSHVLCREVYCTVSLFGRVHYRRLHCMPTCVPNTIMLCPGNFLRKPLRVYTTNCVVIMWQCRQSDALC